MSQLMWWAIFLVPTLTAVAWAVWRTHPSRPADAFDSVKAHHRFVEALSRNERDSERSDRGSQ